MPQKTGKALLAAAFADNSIALSEIKPTASNAAGKGVLRWSGSIGGRQPGGGMTDQFRIKIGGMENGAQAI